MKRNSIIVLFAIVLIALAILIYVVPGVTGMLVATYTAEYGNLSIYDDSTAYFIRDESVYGADQGGDVNRLAQEGDLLRPFTNVVEITGTSPDATGVEDGESGDTTTDRITQIKNDLAGSIKTGTDYRTESGGIVSFYVDGHENTLLTDSIDSIKFEDLEEIHQSDVVDAGLSVRTGYPVYKIINNTGWYIVAYVPKEHIDDYSVGGSCDVTFYEKDENKDGKNLDLSEDTPLYNTVQMLIEGIEEEGDYGKLVLRSSRFFGGVGQYRVANAHIVSSDVSGLLIENESVAEVDGVSGVYVKSKTGKYNFVPVLIYGQNDTTTVVADGYYYDINGEYTRTVDPFDDILRHPDASSEIEGDDEK